MRLATRLKFVEANPRPDGNEPRLVIVLEDKDGSRHESRRNVVAPATIGPWVKVIDW